MVASYRWRDILWPIIESTLLLDATDEQKVICKAKLAKGDWDKYLPKQLAKNNAFLLGNDSEIVTIIFLFNNH